MHGGGELVHIPDERQFPICLVPREAGDGGDEDMEMCSIPCMLMANCFIPCVLLQDTKAEINAELSYIYIYEFFGPSFFS